MKKTFEAEGLVLGNLWGGGKGAYPTIKIKADSEEELETKINQELDSGGLDGGMGFESLQGAAMIVTQILRAEIDGLPFVNRTHETCFFGTLDEMDQEFLLDNLGYM
jgi:hypothetical protein